MGGDLEVVKEDDLMGMIENIDDDTYFEKIKPTQKVKTETPVSVSQKRKQSEEKFSADELTSKKRSVASSNEQTTKVSATKCDTSVTTKIVEKVESEVSASDIKVCDSASKEEKKPKPKEKEKEKPKEMQQLSKTIKTLAAKKAKLSATKKEAPKGGVAMFGGANLFGDNNNPFAHRRGDSDKEEENEEMETEAQNGKLHSKNNILPEKFAPKTFDSIAIQPDAEETGIDLEAQPSSDHVISSVLKDRPKIPQKRKLPSKVTQRLDGDNDSQPRLPNGSCATEQQENERRLA